MTFARLFRFKFAPLRSRWRGRARFVDTFIPKGGIGAEIGVYKGQFSRTLLDIAKPSRLHLIDPWYLLGLEWRWGKGNRSTIDALVRVIRTYRRELAEGKVVLNIADDMDLLPTFSDGYFDWVYLDSTHGYEQTVRELEILARKVKPGGLIAGDDWHEDPQHKHFGVCKAIREFVEHEPYEILYSSVSNTQWAIRKTKPSEI